MKKESVNTFVMVRFHEHPTIDFKKYPVSIFDVTSEGNKNFSSDFIANGDFDHEQYCKCLIETAFALPENKLSSFLDYQCARLKTPYRWLVRFETLLDCNQGLITTYQEKLQGKLNLLIQLLEDKRNLHSGYVKKKELLFFKSDSLQQMDERFDIVKIKKELKVILGSKKKRIYLNRCRVDYLQEVEDNEDAFFIRGINREIEYIDLMAKLEKDYLELQETGIINEAVVNQSDTQELIKIPFSRKPIVLADLFWRIMQLGNEDGSPLFDTSVIDYARFLCNNFCKSDGRPFSENSIRSYFTNFRSGKPASKKSQVDISKIELLED